MFVRCLVFALAAVLTAASSASGVFMRDDFNKPIEQRNLRLRIQTIKTDYLKFEAIPLLCWLENTGSETEFFRWCEIKAFDSEFDVRDEQGKPAPTCGIRGGQSLEETRMYGPGVFGHDWTEVKPGQTSQRVLVNLLDKHGVGANLFCFYLAPGRYTISGEGARSDTITITIHEPSSPEDVEAAALLEGAITAHKVLAPTGRGSWMPDNDEQSRLCSLFLERFPKSTYVSVALSQLLQVSKFLTEVQTEPSESHSIALRLLLDFPESGFAQQCLAYLNPSLVTPDQIPTVRLGLLQIQQLYPNTRNVSDRVAKLLEKLGK